MSPASLPLYSLAVSKQKRTRRKMRSSHRRRVRHDKWTLFIQMSFMIQHHICPSSFRHNRQIVSETMYNTEEEIRLLMMGIVIVSICSPSNGNSVTFIRNETKLNFLSDRNEGTLREYLCLYIILKYEHDYCVCFDVTFASSREIVPIFQHMNSYLCI